MALQLSVPRPLFVQLVSVNPVNANSPSASPTSGAWIDCKGFEPASPSLMHLVAACALPRDVSEADAGANRLSDHYGRIVATCFVRGEDLNHWMVGEQLGTPL